MQLSSSTNATVRGRLGSNASYAIGLAFVATRQESGPAIRMGSRTARSRSSAWLYFECHDVGDYDQLSRAIASDTFLAGTVKNVQGKWVFWDMTAGSSSPLSADHYYFFPS